MAMLTKKEAAQLVTGTVTVTVAGADGKPIMRRTESGEVVYETRTVPVSADVVMGFRIDGEEIVVMTIDGQKLRAPLRPAPALAAGSPQLQEASKQADKGQPPAPAADGKQGNVRGATKAAV